MSSLMTKDTCHQPAQMSDSMTYAARRHRCQVTHDTCHFPPLDAPGGGRHQEAWGWRGMGGRKSGWCWEASCCSPAAWRSRGRENADGGSQVTPGSAYAVIES